MVDSSGAGADIAVRARSSTLVNRNVTIRGRRTSLRLEPLMWEALYEIARREGLTIHELCTLVQDRRQESTLTAAIRVFILIYFREAATEDGHELAGHGCVAGRQGRCHGTRPGRRRRGSSAPALTSASTSPSRVASPRQAGSLPRLPV